MLVLSRKPGQILHIGEDIQIQIVETKGNAAYIGIDAPKEITIFREEVLDRMIEEQNQATENNTED